MERSSRGTRMRRVPGSSQALRGGMRGRRDRRAGAAAAAELGNATWSILSGFGKTGERTRPTHLGQRSEKGPGPLKGRLLHSPRGPLPGTHWAPVCPRRLRHQEKPAARWGDAPFKALPARNKQGRMLAGPTIVEMTHQEFTRIIPLEIPFPVIMLSQGWAMCSFLSP